MAIAFLVMFLNSTFTPQEAYAILNRFEVEVTKEESEAVDTLRYSFNKLQSKAVSTNLILISYLCFYFLSYNDLLKSLSPEKYISYFLKT